MSTEQDSVRRLAEIREDVKRGWYPSREDVVYLLSLIDSLTAERDDERHRKEVAEFEREEVRAALTRVIEAADARAEAAEAEVKRLREALELFAVADVRTHILQIQSAARAALATPPSEGGQP